MASSSKRVPKEYTSVTWKFPQQNFSVDNLCVLAHALGSEVVWASIPAHARPSLPQEASVSKLRWHPRLTLGFHSRASPACAKTSGETAGGSGWTPLPPARRAPKAAPFHPQRLGHNSRTRNEETP